MRSLSDANARMRPTTLTLPVLGGLILLAALAGCGRHGNPSPAGGSDMAPSKINLKRNVVLDRAEQRSMVYHIETVGVLEPEGQTEIAAGVNGVVDEVLFREGDLVTPQTILVKVDQRRYVAAQKVAEANEQRAQAALRLAKDAADRTERAGVGASAEEKTRAALNLGLAEAELQSARAQRELAQSNLDRSRVRAPYAGKINQRRITTPGTYLEDKTVIATMADLSRVRLVAWVPETSGERVGKLFETQQALRRAAALTLPLGGFLASELPWAGIAALIQVQSGDVPSGFDPEFTLRSLPGRSYRANVFYLSTVASPDTHMFECKAEVMNPGAKDELRPGYFARIRMPLLSKPNACIVPEESVRATEKGFVAFVPVKRIGKDGKEEWIAKARTLDLGFRTPGWVEVRSGIRPGDWMVRKGAEALEDGTPIQFDEPPGF